MRFIEECLGAGSAGWADTTVATTLKRKSVSGRSLKIFQLLTNTPNQISGQQDRFLTRRATELVEYFLNLSCSWTLESLLS